MDHPIGALPRTPFPASRDFPSRGNEKICGTGYCVTYDTDSQSRNALASPLGEEGHEVAKGCTRVRMIMILDVDVTAERRHYKTHRPLKGKRLTTFCASLALLHPLLSLTHWIFRSLMLPYKSSSHSAKCVRCASLRSGGPPIGGQDRDGASYRCSAPYTLSRFAGFPLKGKRENRWHWILCHI